MSEILVERHWEQTLSDADMHSMLASAGGCLGIHRVNWHGSRLSADGHELFCHFSAADAESVRLALQAASIPVERVWAFRRFSTWLTRRGRAALSGAVFGKRLPAGNNENRRSRP